MEFFLIFVPKILTEAFRLQNKKTMKTNRNYFLFNKENGKSLNLQLIDGQWFCVNRYTGEKSRLSEEELYDNIFAYGVLYVGSEQVKHRYRTVLNRREAIYFLKHKL